MISHKKYICITFVFEGTVLVSISVMSVSTVFLACSMTIICWIIWKPFFNSSSSVWDVSLFCYYRTGHSSGWHSHVSVLLSASFLLLLTPPVILIAMFSFNCGLLRDESEWRMGEELGQLTREQSTSTILTTFMSCPGQTLKRRRCGEDVCQNATID